MKAEKTLPKVVKTKTNPIRLTKGSTSRKNIRIRMFSLMGARRKTLFPCAALRKSIKTDLSGESLLGLNPTTLNAPKLRNPETWAHTLHKKAPEISELIRIKRRKRRYH